MSRRLSTSLFALAALGMAGAAAPATAGDIIPQFGWQDRDSQRSVSLGGSCNRCELSGRDLSGATFTAATFTSATFVGANLAAPRS